VSTVRSYVRAQPGRAGADGQFRDPGHQGMVAVVAFASCGYSPPKWSAQTPRSVNPVHARPVERQLPGSLGPMVSGQQTELLSHLNTPENDSGRCVVNRGCWTPAGSRPQAPRQPWPGGHVHYSSIDARLLTGWTAARPCSLLPVSRRFIADPFGTHIHHSWPPMLWRW